MKLNVGRTVMCRKLWLTAFSDMLMFCTDVRVLSGVGAFNCNLLKLTFKSASRDN